MNEDKLELVQEIAGLGYFEWDLATGYFFCSNQFYRNIGLPPPSAPSLDCFLNTFHPEDLELIRMRLIQPPATDVSDADYRAVRPDGSVVWLHLRTCSWVDQNGVMGKRFGIIQDITGRKQLELDLKKLTECLSQINNSLRTSQNYNIMALSIAKLGYFEWDITQQTIFWSEQQYINLDYTPEKVVPSVALFLRRLHPDDVNKVKTVSHNIPTGKYAEVEFRILKSDGSVGWLSARATAVTDPQGRLSMVLGVTQDITEKKLAEDQAKKAERNLTFINQLNTRSDYLNRLLENDYPREYTSKALSEFGIESHAGYCCFVLQVSNKTAQIPNVTCASKDASTILQNVLIWLATRGYDKIWSLHNDIILLMPVIDEGLRSKQNQLAFSSALFSALKKQYPFLSVTIGISGRSDIPFNIKESYEKASRAAIVATAGSLSPMIHFDDIGLYDIAFQLIKDKNIVSLANSTIGRLSDYDHTRGGNLLLTLKYILEDNSLKTVAKKLYIHPNTAIWRKRRIEELLDMSLDKMESKVTLMLHLRIWELQHISDNKAD
jgi:PAS domain S-box-containing protein